MPAFGSASDLRESGRVSVFLRRQETLEIEGIIAHIGSVVARWLEHKPISGARCFDWGE